MAKKDDPYKEFEDLVECPLCMVKPVNPKTLPCQHWCCEPCLTWYIQTSVYGDQLLCPECRVGVQIPAGGARSFPPAIFVNRLNEVIQNQRKSQENAKLICPEHHKSFELFCEKCQQLLCVLCVLDHEGHKKTTRKQAWENQKISVLQDREHLDAKIKEYNRQLEEVNKAQTDFLTEVDTHERAIRQQKEKIIIKVNAIEASVQKKITAQRNTAVDKFTHSKNQLKMKLSTVSDSIKVLESTLEEGIPLTNVDTQPYQKLIKEPEAWPPYHRPTITINLELPNLDQVTKTSLFGEIEVKTLHVNKVDFKWKKRKSTVTEVGPSEYKKQATFENDDKPSTSTNAWERFTNTPSSSTNALKGFTHTPSSSTNAWEGFAHTPSSNTNAWEGFAHTPSSSTNALDRVTDPRPCYDPTITQRYPTVPPCNQSHVGLQPLSVLIRREPERIPTYPWRLSSERPPQPSHFMENILA